MNELKHASVLNARPSFILRKVVGKGLIYAIMAENIKRKLVCLKFESIISLKF